MCVRIIFLLGLVVAPLIPGFSQPEADSLQRRIPAEQNDTLRVLMLNRLSELRIFSNPKQALELAQEARALAEKSKYTRGIILSNHRIGTATWSKGDLVPALKALNLSLGLAETNNLSDLIALNVGRIGLIYAASGNYSSANQYYKRALPLFVKAGNKEQIYITYNNLGKSFLEINQLDSAEFYLKQSMFYQEQQHLAERPIVLFNLADLYFKRGDYAACEQFLERCLTGAKRTNDRRARARYYQLHAELNLRRQEVRRAFDYSSRAVALADSVGSKELQYITYKTHAAVLSRFQKSAEAYQYLILYGQYRDSLQSLQLQNLLTLREYDFTQKEIQLLQSREAAAVARSRERLVIILALAAVLLVAVLLAVNFNMLRRRREAMNIQLQHKNDEIEHKAAQLTQADVFKSRILTVLAHDVRSPLASAKSVLDMLATGMVTENEIKEHLPEISGKIDRILELTNTLLAWANIKFKDAASVSAPFELHEHVQNRLAYFSGVAAAKRVTVVSTIAPRQVCADRDLMDMVLRNLVTNAIKFSREGGNVTVSAVVQAGALQVDVADEGHGMAPEAAARLFGNAVVSTEGTLGEKGTGLGLLLCKELLEQFGGSIWIAHTSPQGTTMSFSIPTC